MYLMGNSVLKFSMILMEVDRYWNLFTKGYSLLFAVQTQIFNIGNLKADIEKSNNVEHIPNEVYFSKVICFFPVLQQIFNNVWRGQICCQLAARILYEFQIKNHDKLHDPEKSAFYSASCDKCLSKAWKLPKIPISPSESCLHRCIVACLQVLHKTSRAIKHADGSKLRGSKYDQYAMHSRDVKGGRGDLGTLMSVLAPALSNSATLGASFSLLAICRRMSTGEVPAAHERPHCQWGQRSYWELHSTNCNNPLKISRMKCRQSVLVSRCLSVWLDYELIWAMCVDTAIAIKVRRKGSIWIALIHKDYQVMWRKAYFVAPSPVYHNYPASNQYFILNPQRDLACILTYL